MIFVHTEDGFPAAMVEGSLPTQRRYCEWLHEIVRDQDSPFLGLLALEIATEIETLTQECPLYLNATFLVTVVKGLYAAKDARNYAASISETSSVESNGLLGATHQAVLEWERKLAHAKRLLIQAARKMARTKQIAIKRPTYPQGEALFYFPEEKNQ